MTTGPADSCGAGRLRCRPLEAGDLPERVRWLEHPAIRDGITITYWPRLEDMSRWFASSRFDPGRHDYVVEDEAGSLVAMFGLQATDDGADAVYYGYVNPNLLGRGIGTATVALAVDEARRIGVSRIVLETKRGNTAARRTYEKAGFGYVDGAAVEASKVQMALAFT